jgi:predicted O-linked N-acetylglucosamine transferase (SPINDLY family)
LLPQGSYGSWTALLRERWARSHPVLLDRVEFLPRMTWERFMHVLAAMDVLLDPIHFGSGNTMYDAMLAGVPMVTWPGTFARGRNVAAAYRQMGLEDAPVAEDLDHYVALAVRLGRDAEVRAELGGRIAAAAAQHLFEDHAAVRELEQFLEQAVASAARGERLAAGWRPSSGRPAP